jgi:hypothetical protein
VAKSAFPQTLDKVVTQAWKVLKPLGFAREKRTFNRAAEPGLVQVVNFELGSYPYYGICTVNFGVFVTEIHRALRGDANPNADGLPLTFVDESHCQIRARLGLLLPSQKDTWWNLNRPAEDIAADVVPLVKRYGLPFLERYGTRKAILRAWDAGELDPWLFPPKALSIAIMHIHLGNLERAREIVIAYYSTINKPQHAEFTRKIAAKIGIKLPPQG